VAELASDIEENIAGEPALLITDSTLTSHDFSMK
jgi:hypothetical protein